VIVLVCVEPGHPSKASRAALVVAGRLAAVGNKVTALSAGGDVDNASLVEARGAAGIYRVIHLKDGALDKADFFTLGTVLAEAARHLEATLVITGERSDEEGQGLVPAALAHHLHAPILAHVVDARVAASTADALEITTFAGGCRCVVECSLPVVLATLPLTWPGEQPTSKVACPVEVMELAELGLDPSKLVPRPDLLGELQSSAASKLPKLSYDEAAELILCPTRKDS